MISDHALRAGRSALLALAPFLIPVVASAQATARDTVAHDSVATISGIRITGERDRRPAVTKLTLPVIASVTVQRVQETVNLMDTPDAVKYLPSVFIRKRNNGDTQATMATRVWGLSSSARSLVFADGVPLSALIANNNNIGGPRWGLVAPEEIERIDMMYGPFSAAYSGNSMGAVMEITTRMPEGFEGSITQTQGWQPFDLYNTKATYGTSQTSARVGDRFGKFSFVLSGNYQDSHSQPLSYVTSGTFPNGTTGGIANLNKLNAPANVLGASGLLHTQMSNARVKLAYDLSPRVRAAYSYGWWQNDADATVDPYLRTASGTPTYAGQGGFASGYYNLLQRHSAQSLSVRSDARGDWAFEAVATKYRMDTDRQRFPSQAAATGTTFGTAGRVAQLTGTGWGTLDLKGAWQRGGVGATHVVSAGAHVERYELANPTFNTTDWQSGALGTVVSRGDGKTQTGALWAQDAWRLAPSLRLTVGARVEHWRAYDGLNVNGATTVRQDDVDATRVSPKAILAWNASNDWTLTVSLGKAYRFATAAELYQLVTTGTTFTSPDPNLKPDNVLASEVRVERAFRRGRVQLALFHDDVHDAIISQFKPLVPGSNTFYSYISNVDHVRAQGAELVMTGNDLLVRGLELSASATWLDAKTLATSGRASATAPADAAIGKRVPNIPQWRGTAVATYRPTSRLAATLGARYSGPLWTTLDNADVNPNTYQGFSGWFVADAHVRYRFSQHLAASLGADNLLDRKYFLFHPFPQRNFSSSLTYVF